MQTSRGKRNEKLRIQYKHEIYDSNHGEKPMMGGEYKGKRNGHCDMHVTLLTRCFTQWLSCDSTNCGNSSNNDDDAASVAAKMTMPMMPAASMLQGMPFFRHFFHSTISVSRSGFFVFLI